MHVPTSNNRIANVIQLEEVDDVVNVCKLFAMRNITRLSKYCGEDQGFFDCGCCLMHIHLLTVSGGTLKRNTLGLSIDQNRAIDLACIFPLGEDVQQPVMDVNSYHEMYGVETYVVFPAPEQPMRATRFPGFT